MKSFKIVLPERVYEPGDTITGLVETETSKKKDYHAIKVTLTGHAEVEWSGKENGKRRRTGSTEVQSSHISYIYASINLWERDLNVNDGLLPAGLNQFPFSFKLEGTDDLPASYSDDIGKIVYRLEARVVQKSLLLEPHVDTQEIKVENTVNINRLDLLRPKAIEISETIGHCCCASGPINITATVKRTGFCIERDIIPIDVAVSNRSGKRINEISIKLLKNIKYVSATDSRTDTTIIGSSQSSTPFESHRKGSWSTSITIPKTEDTLTNCSIISITYLLEVTADVIKSHNSVMIPLVLGVESSKEMI